ncbi:ChaN family lipoprotein [Tunicatimonas pelagia]|uniref:ChaN family lipoprotein n=1 Tax=Tunicatimonas pelagia TaxID=931531 RepID=UPI002666656F|nr:ChaN family lipoprotein [Tunicatimonas pelagia]WKN45979.1 ChaN family lipoprotein [Tunicatimonas pelagia]
MTTQLLVMDKPAYRIFDGSGVEVSYESMVNTLDSADVVLFGELHNNALVHWLELQVAKDLYAQDSNLVLGLEMLEADNQLLVNEYLAGTIEQRHFVQEAKLWDNYRTDYEPIVAFAKKNGVSVIATNIPRRYASLVARQGIEKLDSVADQAKKWIAPLPVEIDTTLPGYQNMLNMMGGNVSHGGMSGEKMVQAQAIKDATMAHFIRQNIEREGVFLHLNGSYHSDNFEGIYWYLKQYSPDLNIKTVSSVEQTTLDSLEEEKQGVADYIIVTPTDMAHSY